VSFKGTIDGEPFEGGTAEDVPVVLGSGLMVPGFESQLEGVTEGQSRELTVTFPDSFPREELRGKTASFATDVKAVKAPLPVAVDDELAKQVGLDDLAALRKAMRDRLEEEYRTAGRNKLKRQLLDRLALSHPFEVPQGMVDLEFEGIWRQLKDEMERTGQTFEAEGETEEKAKEEYRRIADRRVRLGLILSDIGNRNDIKVEPQELQQAMLREARRFPGQERQVLEFFRKNTGALEQLRAPIFEDKVCEFIFQLAKVSEQPVTPEALLAEPDDEGEAVSAEPAETAGT
jgi:trigger factor